MISPFGGLLAVSWAVRGRLTSYLSIMEDQFIYVPKDIIVPGIVEAGDISDVVSARVPRAVLLDNMVDGRDRLVENTAGHVRIAEWLRAHLF